MDSIRSFVNRLNPEKDCDIFDRITCYYTVVILTIFSFIIFGWSLFGSPIQCWFPAQYRGWWSQYALDYCYVQNTYFVKFHEGKPQNHWELDNQRIEIPHNYEDRQSLTIGYYQWVPFILALMAISFYVPVAFWRAMYEHSGISVKTIMEQAVSARSADGEKRKATSRRVAQYLDQTKRVCERFRNTVVAGRYVTFLYLLTKLLSLIICVGQFVVLEHFLGVDSSWWGITILNDIRNGREWTETGNFPRVTLCDYKVRELGALHHHTVQCVLLINMLNEKIFVFLWFWFAFIAILSAFSLLFWAYYVLFPYSEREFVTGYLLHVDPRFERHKDKKKIIADFINGTLKQDGVFLLRLIVHNSGDLVCAELLRAIWSDYKRRNKLDIDAGDDGERPPPAQNVRLAEPGVDRAITGYPTLPSYDDVDKIKHRRAPPPPPPPRPIR